MQVHTMDRLPKNVRVDLPSSPPKALSFDLHLLSDNAIAGLIIIPRADVFLEPSFPCDLQPER